ncbi:MAG TPA: amino acid adenylation domain-containing protein, partial [Thermoanaerobaculia bacterium]|nr:amino acid adenylation domain-containing protein [Thermoanaerobaculia bacterium]
AGFLEYDTDLFDAATMDRLLAHFEVLLAGAVAEPATRLSELPLLTSEERQQLLAEAGADVEAPWRTLHEGFERQAERTPDRIAVVWGEQRMSYGDLARRSGEMVAGPETIVAVRMPRTPELVVRLLGVLRSGAAYLPIDPSYPEERAEWMIADAGALTPRPPLPTALPATGRGGEGNLAYLIYTSGSTGRPKAVAIEHVSAVRMVAWAGTVYGEEELAGVLASTSVSFDLSIFEIFVPLLHGGTVILIDDALTLHDVPAAVTLINTVPSAMAGLLELGPLPASVKTVNLAGEPLRQALADRVYEAGVERLWNLYGPSEDTTYSTGEIVQKGKEPGIGRPVAGSRAYVLDRALRLQPVGVPGELCLGGGGLARGYLRRPELTAERWVPDPFSGEPGARLYLTGDLGWWREGRLEYLGRLDRQVKVRGFRIEPGEIEAALLAHPAVRDAAVLAREGTLAAFVVPAPDVPFRLEELRRHLQSRLPAPLVPSSFTRLTGLPLTPNGKVDREALARFGKAPERPAFEPPRGHLEETLAAVWADVLNIQRIGRHDDFFHLGGHSLLATRIVSRLRSLLGVELPVRALFETPTLAGLAARIEREDRLPEPPIERIPPGEPAPLSFAQQRLWFLNQLDPTSPVYNLPVAVRFVSPSPGEGGQGGRERGPGGEGLSAILRRHDALRTVFPSTEAGPVQVVTPPAPFHLPLIDLSALNDAETAAHQLIQAEARRPFDLERGPVFRALLVQVRPGDHTLAVTMHHIVSDGWSLGVFVRELAASSPLPELPVQYADYAVWQRRRLTGELLERELAFWREELRGLPPGLDLPADRPRPALRTFRGGRRPFHLDACLANGLRALARREAATPFMVAMAGFQALLSRLTGQDDLAVGTPVAGRTRVDLEDLIGFFVNTLVLRADLSGDPDVRELLGRVRSRALAAQAHQDLPFEKLVEELQPVRDLARTPFFQTLLVFQNTGREPLHIPGLTVETFEVETGTAKFDFALSLEERGEEIAGAAELNLDLFDPATVDRLLGHLRTLLAGMVEEPGRRLSELPLLSEPERRQILIDWNPAGIELPPVCTLAELFEEQAARRPDAPAVVHGDERWSYGDLDRAANRLARRLRRLGVGPEVRVALHLDRSIGQVAAILGVIKAGGVYVPLDPTWPAERIDFVLEDSGAKVTVTPELLEEHEDDSPLPLSTLLENAAYVIYTSGSTGKPKGVAVTHANVARLLSATRHWFGFDEDDVWTMFHSYAFDFSVWEMWGALAHGGRLVVVPYETSRSPEALHRLLTAEKVTVLNQTPSAFRQLGPGEGETSLRSVIFGGEALDPTSLAPWFERYGDERPRLVNMYGITEITVHGTYRPVNRLDAGSPIGVPIPDLRIHLLDWHLQPVPALAPGEICVGGAGLARGYLGRPDLTAEHFVPDPFAGLRGETGARLYRSGDLARYRPDGDVEYLGRIDQQVKIRGFRIEPGEVEAALALHPKVGESAVVAREDRPGDRRLVAYVTPRNGLAPATDELRAFLRERLPDYMVPAAFLPLPALPLTANGKLDRRALPAPEPAARPVSAPPRNATEEAIADAWREVLGVPAIGVDDNFFDLGGHSLLLVQAHRRLRERFPEVAVVDLFRFPTVASLALYLTREQVEQIPLEASRERAESRAGRLRRQRLRRG